MTKYGHFLCLSIKKYIKVSDLTQKAQNWKKKFFTIFGPLCHPPRGTHISAARALIKNRLDRSSNLAYWSVHAKFQSIRSIQLARAMGRVRFLTSHLVIGGHLYKISNKFLLKEKTVSFLLSYFWSLYLSNKHFFSLA